MKPSRGNKNRSGAVPRRSEENSAAVSESQVPKRKGIGGGTPGNLNAAKNCLPALRRLRRGGTLPSKLQRVVEIAEREAGDIEADKGGVERMTAVERSLLQNWRISRSCLLLVLDELLERGAVMVKSDGSWDLQPGMQRLTGLLGEERRALLALGLDRREVPVISLQEYLRGKANREEE